MNTKRFEHNWNPDKFGECTMDFEPSEDALIEMDMNEKDGFWLTANKEGYQYLARFFAEIAEGDFEDGWHTHKDEFFNFSSGAPEFTFCVSNDKSTYKNKS